MSIDPENLPFMHFGYPIAGIFFYGAILITYWPKDGVKTKTSPMLKPFVLLHNILLAVFSGYIFVKTAPHFLSQFLESSSISDFLVNGYRGSDWNYFAPFAWVFYMSKYYEFIDTFIHLVKGNKPITLQILHHIGAVATMWLIVLVKQPGTWIFVIFNSLIHTLMYSYYTLCTLGFKPKWKMLMTTMQITQFVTGITAGYSYLAAEGAQTPIQSFSLAFTVSYVNVVLYMFCEFFYATFFSKPKLDVKSILKVD